MFNVCGGVSFISVLLMCSLFFENHILLISSLLMFFFIVEVFQFFAMFAY